MQKSRNFAALAAAAALGLAITVTPAGAADKLTAVHAFPPFLVYTQTFLALVEEFRLPRDDARRHLEQRLVANLETANQPARLLQLGTQDGMVAEAAAPVPGGGATQAAATAS